MPDAQVLAAILAVGAASYGVRAAGFLAGGAIQQGGVLARILRLAPGNFFAAFAAAGILEGGWPCLAGSLAAVATMAAAKREWAALGAGFAVAFVIAMALRTAAR